MKYIEKNNKVLESALLALKGYDPPELVWNQILQHDLDKPLSVAIDRVGGFNPPDSIWGAISDDLDNLKSDTVLHEGIEKLKGYEPPNEIWEHIENELFPKKGKMVRMKFVKSIMAVAAVGLLFLMVKPYFSESEVSIVYSEETIEVTKEEMNWDEDEDTFQMVSEWCKTGNIACKLPEFKALKSEMDDLNNAKMILKSEISNFETDNTLIAQLTQIEIERGNILKQMISMM